jgi:Asp-tRNA(Asn)/Glu-tRNA(Gln) amidotransferase A subunit family amidase
MTAHPLTHALRQLRRLADEQAGPDLSDAALLQRFRAGGEETAFALLVQRHGPMVLGVCRRVLGDRHEAEDAFQATFLVLVRRAGAIHTREALGSWLYRVAYRVAARARGEQVRRRAAAPHAASCRPSRRAATCSGRYGRRCSTATRTSRGRGTAAPRSPLGR